VLCDWNHLIWWLQWIFEERSSRDRLVLTAEWFVWKHALWRTGFLSSNDDSGGRLAVDGFGARRLLHPLFVYNSNLVSLP
jgi:hypothetical protein